MADPELGTKQVCPNCESKFYDLNKRPALCPKCGHSFDPADETAQAMKTKVRSKAAKAAVPEDDEEDLEDAAAAAATPSEDDEEENREDEARELGGDEDEVVLEMNDSDSDDEAPGKVPTGFTEEGVDDDEDEDEDLGLDDEFDLGDDDVDIDDENTLGEPDADDINPEKDDK